MRATRWIVLLGLAVPAPALACGNVVIIDKSEAARRIRDAEAAVERGEYEKARDALHLLDIREPGDDLPPALALDGTPRERKPSPAVEALYRRMWVVDSLAEIRLARERLQGGLASMGPYLDGILADPALAACYGAEAERTREVQAARERLLQLQREQRVFTHRERERWCWVKRCLAREIRAMTRACRARFKKEAQPFYDAAEVVDRQRQSFDAPNADRADDPRSRALAADWGSLLGGKHRERALQTMTDLESRDLIPDPYGWALLSWLRGLAGDAPGRDRALARCRQGAAAPRQCDWAAGAGNK